MRPTLGHVPLGTEVAIAGFGVPVSGPDGGRTPPAATVSPRPSADVRSDLPGRVVIAGDDSASYLLTVERLTGERAGWRLSGEIDISSQERFGGVLSSLTAEQCGVDGLIHLELAQLTFIDLAGTRSLIRAAQQLHDTAAGHLAVHDPPYALRRVAGLLLGQLDIDGDGTLTLPVASGP